MRRAWVWAGALACAPGADLPCAGEACADELAADPTVDDADGDGQTDAEELACRSDPEDAAVTCYACGWPHGDPGTLSGVGPELGDTLVDATLKDQCREDVRLWDLAGAYRILYLTASWCPTCRQEATKLQARGEAFSRRLGSEVGYVVVLFEDDDSQPPAATVAVAYADGLGLDAIPVLADREQVLIAQTPYDGRTLAGKCVLSPELELLHCTSGHGDDEDLYAILAAHAGR